MQVSQKQATADPSTPSASAEFAQDDMPQGWFGLA